jgi:rod shape-determining protein MreC
VLVLLSIALITIYFREPANGRLHHVQSVGATVLRPFEVAADRVARPFRDAYGYMSGLASAKSENKRLKAENERLRQQVTQFGSAAAENAQLRALLHYRDAPSFPRDYRPVAASVIAVAPDQFQQQIVVAAGSSSGVRRNDPVVTADGLVGHVTAVTPDTAQVTLLTDETSAVSVMDLQTGARGIVRHGSGTGCCSVGRVTHDQVVHEDDQIVTSGWRYGQLSSIYPKGIPVGKVTSVGQVDTDLFKQVQIEPYVNFASLSSVLVLVSKKPVPKLP